MQRGSMIGISSWHRRCDARDSARVKWNAEPHAPVADAAARWQAVRRWLLAHAPARDRLDLAVVAGIVVAVALRWTDRSRFILSWDGATFALASEDYNMDALRPHAPGYPLFVLMIKLMRAVVPEANAAMVALSLLFVAVGVCFAYWLARAVANRAVALALAVLLLAAPLVYVHGATANVYTADLAASCAVAWAAWTAHLRRDARSVTVLAAALAVAVGIRPSILLFLAPVVAWGALQPPWTWTAQRRRLAPGTAVGAAIGSAWFISMALLSDGFTTWRRDNRLQSEQIVFGDTVFQRGWAMAEANLDRLALFLQWELRFVLPVVATLVAVAWLVRIWRSRRLAPPGAPATTTAIHTRRVAGFLAAWLLPALLFYVLVFDGWNEGPSGYAMVVLPGLLLAALLCAAWSLRTLRTIMPTASVTVVALLLVGGTAAALGQHRRDVPDVDYRAHDEWAAAWSHLPEMFPPENTSIVTLWNFAHVWWYFPDYTVYNYRAPRQGPGEAPDFLMVQVAKDRAAVPDWYDAVAAGPSDERHPLPAGTEHLVLFDFQFAGENGGPRRVPWDVPIREAHLPNGWRVLVVDTTPDKRDMEDYFVVDPGPMPASAG